MLLPPDRLHNFVRSFYTWDTNSLGSANPRILADKFTFNGFFAFSQIIGLPIEYADMIYYYLMFTSAGLSMYFLTTTVIRKEYRHLAGLISALFYMFNPYFAIHNIPQLWIYIIFLPLVLGLYIKGVNEKRGLKYIFIMSLIWVLTTASAYVNPKFAIFSWAPLFLYLIFHIIITWSKNEFSQSIIFTGKLLIVWTALNSYWLLATILTFKDVLSATSMAYTAIGASRLSDFIVGSGSFVEAVRLMGYSGFLSGFKGFPYFYWAPAYSTVLFIVIGFLIPIIGFTYILYKPRDKYAIFFSIVTIGGLLAMTGAKAPFGWFSTYLVTHIPLLVDVVSAPYQVGGMYVTMGYAFLLGVTMSSFCKSNLKSKLVSTIRKERIIKGTVVGLILFSFIGVYAYPFWTGDVVYQGNEVLGSSRFNVPAYYYDARAWLNTQQEDFNIFPMPYSILGYAAYTWEPAGFSAPDPTEGLLGKPLVSSLSGGGIGAQVARYFASNSTDYIAKLLALLNVKYIIFHHDANWQFLEGNGWYISLEPENFQSAIGSQNGFHLEATFGELDFYRNEYWEPIHVVAASSNILIKDLSELSHTVKRSDFNVDESVILLSDQLDAQQLSLIPIDEVFIQNQVTATNNTLLDITHPERVVYTFSPHTSIVARYYSGWKGVVSTNGQDSPYLIAFESPDKCPYIGSFPMNFSNWNAYDSSLVYITTTSLPLTITSISADGNNVAADAWWETGTSWLTRWPIIIPPGQHAIIQVNNHVSNITLHTDVGAISLPVQDGWVDPPPINISPTISNTIVTSEANYYLLAIKFGEYNYDRLVKIDNQIFSIINDFRYQKTDSVYYSKPIYLSPGTHTISISEGSITIPLDNESNLINWNLTFKNRQYVAQYYSDWQAIIRTDGSDPLSTISFPTKDQCPYIFPENLTNWNSYDSTLVYMVTSDEPVHITGVSVNGGMPADIIGIWWEKGWVGMNTNPVTYPVIIPAHQRAIIQINQKAEIVTIQMNPPETASIMFYSLKNGEDFVDITNLISSNLTNSPSIIYDKINPTKYIIQVNASTPYSLILSQSYDKNWVATINGQQISEQSHFVANGYANGWYINKTGVYTITLEFSLQNLFYIGSSISITAFVICVIFLSRRKIKTYYWKYLKNKISNKA